MNRNGMLKPALIGGILLGILSAMPLVSLFNCFCCAWVLGGGILAAHLYVRNSPLTVTLGSGVLLGLFTGAIGAVVDTLFNIPLNILLTNMGMGFAEQARQLANELPNLPPEMREALQVVASSGTINLAFFIVTGLFKIVVYALIAMLGGALGVALFEKRKIESPTAPYQEPVRLPPPPSPPPPPPPPPPDSSENPEP